MKGLKIGIAFNPTSLWRDDTLRTLLNLYYTLNNSTNKYNVYLLNMFGMDHSNDIFNDLNILDYNTSFTDMDVLVFSETPLNKESISKFKEQPNKKVISYINHESIVYLSNSIFNNTRHESKNIDNLIKGDIDEIWHTGGELGQYLIENISSNKTVEVPFIWDNRQLDTYLLNIEKTYDTSCYYSFGKKTKTLGILQENENLEDSFIIPALISNSSYKTQVGKALIENVVVSSTISNILNIASLNLIKGMDFTKDKKLNILKSIDHIHDISINLDILLCNYLNEHIQPNSYVLLDAIYLGYPVIHNIKHMKKFGYYYKDINEATSVLNNVLLNHDKNYKKYNAKNRKNLVQYCSDNIELIKSYDTLLINLFRKNSPSLNFNRVKNIFT